MPATSEKQKRFFGAVEGAKHGQKNVSGKAKKVAKEISDKDAKKFLHTADEDEETNPSKTPKKKDSKPKPMSLEDAFNASTKAKGKVDKGYNRFNPKHKDYDDPLADEDEQSVSKKMKKGGGKAEFKGPNVKERKHFAPPSKEHKPEKGKGSYDRKKKLDENSDIVNFIECLLVKNYASANKYLNNAVESKLLKKVEEELEKPLFHTYE